METNIRQAPQGAFFISVHSCFLLAFIRISKKSRHERRDFSFGHSNQKRPCSKRNLFIKLSVQQREFLRLLHWHIFQNSL